MERRELIKQLGLGSISLLMPAAILKEKSPSELWVQKIKIYDNFLKGVMYYDLIPCLSQIQVGDRVLLQRQAQHRYDRFAIGVQWKDKFLGYLPAYENIVLANLLDAGAELEAMITYKGDLHHVGIGVWIHLALPPQSPDPQLSQQAADSVEDLYRRHRIFVK